MAKVKGKKKSGKSERDIARFFTNWLTDQTRILYFWRSPGSGAVATVNLGNKALSGDLIALRPEAAFFTDLFSVEVKDGYDDTCLFQHLKENKSFNIKEFWEQCTRDAYDHDKLPLLLYKKLNGIFTASFDEDGFFLVKTQCRDLPSISMTWNNGLPPLFMFDMKKLFDRVTPEDFKNAKV